MPSPPESHQKQFEVLPAILDLVASHADDPGVLVGIAFGRIYQIDARPI